MAQADTFQDIDALHREIDRAFENLVPFTGPFARMAFLPGGWREAIHWSTCTRTRIVFTWKRWRPGSTRRR